MIKSIELENFRKFETLSINTESKIVILTGPNAIGKTSVLESIYLISTSKSHRTNDIEDVIEENKNYSIIKINSDKRFKLVLSNEGRKSFINDKEYTLGYFDSFECGKYIYEMAVLAVKYNKFAEWYNNIDTFNS